MARRTKTATWIFSSSCRREANCGRRRASTLPASPIFRSISLCGHRRTCVGVWRKAIRFCARSWRWARFCMKKLTREWVRKAESDYHAAGKLARVSGHFHDEVCFHCQQSAEKYLKALLEEIGSKMPRTHNLVNLLAVLLPHHPSLRPLRRGLKFLTRFAVGTRYPRDDP